MKYYIDTTLDISFEEAEKKVTDALKEEGFGILTEIDVKNKFKEKLNIDFKQYKILGACNPEFAHKALCSEDKIGTMLPCNIIIQETDDHKTEVAAVDPKASMLAVQNTDLEKIAEEIQKKLTRVIGKL